MRSFKTCFRCLVGWILLNAPMAALAQTEGVSSQTEGASSQSERELPLVVMLIAEREYKTGETLPQFAADHLAEDYRVAFVEADPMDPNRMVGLNVIAEADVLLVSVRRRTLPQDQLKLIRDYVSAGKGVVGIRTANHAFCLRGKDPAEGYDAWPSFDQDVFGGNYSNHYGNDLKATITSPLVGASISDESTSGADRGDQLEALSRRQEPFTVGGSLYKVSPLVSGTRVLLNGNVEGKPSEPVAWTFKRADGGKSFYTSLGHVDDFGGSAFPIWLRTAIDWAADGAAEEGEQSQ